jgi:hypothetical protein
MATPGEFNSARGFKRLYCVAHVLAQTPYGFHILYAWLDTLYHRARFR